MFKLARVLMIIRWGVKGVLFKVKQDVYKGNLKPAKNHNF
jgi:hypothetical protein